MIQIENGLGTISINQEYFSKLIGNAASTCFGVAGMSNVTPSRRIQKFFARISRSKNNIDKGVFVHMQDNMLTVDLHIIVTYGLNIAAIVKSIVNKVRYTVEQATGLEVRKVNVFVDSMKSE